MLPPRGRSPLPPLYALHRSAGRAWQVHLSVSAVAAAAHAWLAAERPIVPERLDLFWAPAELLFSRQLVLKVSPIAVPRRLAYPRMRSQRAGTPIVLVLQNFSLPLSLQKNTH